MGLFNISLKYLFSIVDLHCETSRFACASRFNDLLLILCLLVRWRSHSTQASKRNILLPSQLYLIVCENNKGFAQDIFYLLGILGDVNRITCC